MIRDLLVIIDGAGNLGDSLVPALTFAELHDAALTIHVVDEQPAVISVLDPSKQFRVDQETIASNERHVAKVQALTAGAPMAITVQGITEHSLLIAGTSVPSARTADLVLIGPAKTWRDPFIRRKFVEALLFGSGCPILLYPASWQPRRFRHVVLGWNDFTQASRAARSALSLIEPAAKIDVVMIDRDQAKSGLSQDPHMALQRHLAQHDCSVKLVDLELDTDRTVDLLCDYALDAGADMLVIGAFSHSPFREELLGGVTESLIDHQRLPILLAH